jgi:hypothetical protein
MQEPGKHERLDRQAGSQRLCLGRCTRIRRWVGLCCAHSKSLRGSRCSATKKHQNKYRCNVLPGFAGSGRGEVLLAPGSSSIAWHTKAWRHGNGAVLATPRPPGQLPRSMDTG